MRSQQNIRSPNAEQCIVVAYKWLWTDLSFLTLTSDHNDVRRNRYSVKYSLRPRRLLLYTLCDTAKTTAARPIDRWHDGTRLPLFSPRTPPSSLGSMIYRGLSSRRPWTRPSNIQPLFKFLSIDTRSQPLPRASAIQGFSGCQRNVVVGDWICALAMLPRISPLATPGVGVV